MSKFGPIIVIEDDEDDQFLIQQALSELGIKNQVVLFYNGLKAYEYLLITKDQPFVILCDINMHILNGLELRESIEENAYLKEKSIPFIFLSTSNSADLIERAYKGTVQGYFKKSSTYSQLKADLNLIVNYWKRCLHPNNLVSSNKTLGL